MDTLSTLLLTAVSLFMLWGLYSGVKKNPLAFSKEALSSSAYTLGILALILIAFISVCIWLLKN